MNHIIEFLSSIISGDELRTADSFISASGARPSDGAFSCSRLKRRGRGHCYRGTKRGDTMTLPSGAVYSVTERGWVRGN